MRPRARLAIALVIVAVAILLVWFRPGSGPARHTGPDQPPSSPAVSPGSALGPRSPGSAPKVLPANDDPRFTRFANGQIHLTASIAASRRLHRGDDARSDLAIIEQLIADYRLVYRENPVGTENAEITAQLLGKNPKNIFFLAPDLHALNDRGALLDRWGSPYVFHPLKADLMDVRSLGPDRKPWTNDDLTLGLEDTEAELQLRP